MKTILILGGLGVLVAVELIVSSQSEEVIKKVEVIEEVAPEWVDESCIECQEAYEAKKRQLQLEADLAVKLEEKAALDAEIEAIEKELGTY